MLPALTLASMQGLLRPYGSLLCLCRCRRRDAQNSEDVKHLKAKAKKAAEKMAADTASMGVRPREGPCRVQGPERVRVRRRALQPCGAHRGAPPSLPHRGHAAARCHCRPC